MHKYNNETIGRRNIWQWVMAHLCRRVVADYSSYMIHTLGTVRFNNTWNTFETGNKWFSELQTNKSELFWSWKIIVLPQVAPQPLPPLGIWDKRKLCIPKRCTYSVHYMHRTNEIEPRNVKMQEASHANMWTKNENEIRRHNQHSTASTIHLNLVSINRNIMNELMSVKCKSKECGQRTRESNLFSHPPSCIQIQIKHTYNGQRPATEGNGQ